MDGNEDARVVHNGSFVESKHRIQRKLQPPDHSADFRSHVALAGDEDRICINDTRAQSVFQKYGPEIQHLFYIL